MHPDLSPDGRMRLLDTLYADHTLASTLVLDSSELSGCSASQDGGGVHAGKPTTLEFIGSTITSSSAGNRGGGLFASNEDPCYLAVGSSVMKSCLTLPASIRASIITDCSATKGGGLHLINTNTQCLGCSISDNIASGDSGGLFQQEGTLDVADSAFERNEAKGEATTEDSSDAASAFRFGFFGTRGSVRNTAFAGNRGGDTVIYKSKLDWDCQPGRYMPETGRSSSTDDFVGCSELCAAGYYGDRPDYTSDKCEGRCPPGEYCEEGSSVPTPCPAGHHMPSSGASDKSSCIPCSPGAHQPSNGSIDCIPCEAGTFSKELAQLECTDCPAGGYCKEAGAATPMVFISCPPGTYSSEQGSFNSSVCTRCPAGTTQLASGASSSDACQACPEGSYSNDPAAPCILCPYPDSSGSGSSSCPICTKGYYLLEDADGRRTGCNPCPPNAECPLNTSLATLNVSRGYWRASPSSAVLTDCGLFVGNDDGGDTRCAGGTDAGEGGDGYCEDGFTGPECQLCSAKDHHLVDGVRCERCRDRKEVTGTLVAVAFSIYVACCLAVWAYFSCAQAWRKRRCCGAPLRLAERIVAWCIGIGLHGKLKIIVSFYQVCTVLSSTYSARLPDKYTDWTYTFGEAIAIDWSLLFLPAGCLPYSLRLATITAAPAALIAVLLLTGAGIWVTRWLAASSPRRTEATTSPPPSAPASDVSYDDSDDVSAPSSSAHSDDESSDSTEEDANVPRPRLAEAVMHGLLNATPPCLVVIFACVPSVSASIFRAWSCQARSPGTRSCRARAVLTAHSALGVHHVDARRAPGASRVHEAGHQRRVRHRRARLHQAAGRLLDRRLAARLAAALLNAPHPVQSFDSDALTQRFDAGHRVPPPGVQAEVVLVGSVWAGAQARADGCAAAYPGEARLPAHRGGYVDLRCRCRAHSSRPALQAD